MFAECLAVGLACGDQRRLKGSGSALEALHDDALYKSTYFTLLFLQTQTDRQTNKEENIRETERHT